MNIGPVAALTAAFALAACGGSGGREPLTITPEDAIGFAPVSILEAAQGVAVSAPVFGSVTQSTGGNDRAGAALSAGPRVALTITRGSGGVIDIDSAAHKIEVRQGVSPGTGRDYADAYLFRYDDSSFTLARVAAEWEPGFDRWIGGGYWLHATGDMRAGTVTAAEVGAFADGPEIRGTPSLPLTGNASYTGVAAGLYGVRYGTDLPGVPAGSIAVGEFGGIAALTADFGAGTVEGSVRAIEVVGLISYPDGTNNPFNTVTDYQVRLAPTQIGADGTVSGSDIDLWHPAIAIDSQGSWGGRFSTVDDSAGNPRLVAGTLGGSGTAPGGTTASFVGGFYGTTPQF